MTHLVDTSVLHTYGRNTAVRRVLDELVSAGTLLTTCPVVVAEYCFSAQTAEMLEQLRGDMALFYLLESDRLSHHIHTVQSALWSAGLVRAAGAADTLIAAYALEHNQTVVTCDSDFLHIAHALRVSGSEKNLTVLAIGHDDELASRA